MESKRITLRETLKSRFGHDDFRPGQEEAVLHLLNGEPTFVLMPTGAGKSLIFQLAALLLPGTTLVISPLIALMKDQVDKLHSLNIPATYLNSMLTAGEQAERLHAIARGEFKIVYVAPERLRNNAFLNALKNLQVSLIAVDEAHCVCQWGYDFRPDYLHIEPARKQWGNPLTVALTATATPKLQREIVRLLGLSNAKTVITGFNRPNLFYEVRSTPGMQAKLESLSELLTGLKQGASIVYTGTRSDAEQVSDFVREGLRLESACYHAGLEPDERSFIQEAFLSGQIPVIVATNAFGMGIDRPDVRSVIHYNIPSSLEAYYQEAGRGGRDGEPARVVLLYAPQDRALQEWFIENTAPSAFEMKNLWYALKRRGQEPFQCDWNDLAHDTGLYEVKLRVGLAGLESVQAITRLGDSGAQMLLQINPQNECRIEESLEVHEKHREVRRVQLQMMMEYAEADTCRRRILLEHFGESFSPLPSACCDNCQVIHGGAAKPDAAQPESLTSHQKDALQILRALNSLRWEVGRERLTELLQGAKTKEIKQYDYERNPYYGKLSRSSRQQIKFMIDGLIKQGYVKQVGGNRPVLHLTPKARIALQQDIAIHLQPLPVPQLPVARTKISVNDTSIITQQLLAQGLSIEQIAQQRNLQESTIYEHLARLIAAGRVEVHQVVPDGIIQQIRQAIETVGRGQPPSLIKSLLPDTVGYHHIRCVIAAIEHEPGTAAGATEADTPLKRWLQSATHSDPAVRLQAVAQIPHDLELPVSLIAQLLKKEMDPNIRLRLVNALASCRGDSEPVIRQIAENESESPFIRLAVRLALGQVGSTGSQETEPSQSILTPSIDHPKPEQPRVDVATYLNRPHPRILKGVWHAGFALDFHSRFEGDRWERTVVGEWVFRLKYENDSSALEPLLEQCLALINMESELRAVDAIVPIPPTVSSETHPVISVACALAAKMSLPVLDALVKTRIMAAQKEQKNRTQKVTNVAGAFKVQANVEGKRLLLIDDLFDSGATLEEATRVLLAAGAARVCVLALTKTIHQN
jgi:ATP-dependent DNA helicase RecQ